MGFKGIFVVIGVAATCASYGFSDLYVFGDSLSDTGNDLILSGGTTPAPPYYEGRFSNGPIWVDDLAAHFGLTDPTPSLAGGTNYAYGGATTAGASIIPSIRQQVATAVGKVTFNSSDLITLWGGANDLLGGQTDAAIPASSLESDIATLYADGARNIIVPNLPALGLLPAVQSQGASAVVAADAITITFDNDLATDLAAQKNADPGLNIYAVNVYGLLNSVVANPGAYGITDTTDELINAPTGTPDTYLFWDDEHPTALGHTIIANAATGAVPEPPVYAGFAVGVVAILRRRKMNRRI